jgi:hypothetical protein
MSDLVDMNTDNHRRVIPAKAGIYLALENQHEFPLTRE